MEEFVDVLSGPAIALWGDAVRAWRLDGERITLSVVELDPGAALPEHVHKAEQVGMCLRGSITFEVDGRQRELRPAGGWRVTTMRPHRTTAGSDGATVVEVFTPVRRTGMRSRRGALAHRPCAEGMYGRPCPVEVRQGRVSRRRKGPPVCDGRTSWW